MENEQMKELQELRRLTLRNLKNIEIFTQKLGTTIEANKHLEDMLNKYLEELKQIDDKIKKLQ